MDMNAAELGVSTESLMRNAGKAVAEYILDNYPDARVRFFCGHGNNGGDGLAAAALIPGSKITMVDGTDMKTEASAAMAEAVKKRMEEFDASESDFDVLVDAGLGTGLSGELRPKWKVFVDFCNSFEGIVVSVDVPTGFGTGYQVVPDATVTMVDTKEGMSQESCGEIFVADIDMPLDAVLFTGPGDILRYPVPSKDSHKGDSGRLLVIGGGPYYGAPALASLAAERIGTDMVYAAVPTNVIPSLSATVPETVVVEIPGDRLTPASVPMLAEKAASCDAVLIGPGLGTDPETREAILALLDSIDKPTVVDADGITAVCGKKLGKHIVVTPHFGEFKRLGGKEQNPSDVRRVASELGCTVLLKGVTDMISDGERICLNSTGCVEMTSAGTGDVLAGTVAGLLARGLTPFDAAKLGAWLIGKAGESAAARFSYGLRAADLADGVAMELADALKRAGLRWTSSPSPESPHSG